MDLTVEQVEGLKQKIAEKQEYLDAFMQQAQRQISFYEGQIAAWKALLEPEIENPEEEKEPEPNGTGRKEKAKA